MPFVKFFLTIAKINVDKGFGEFYTTWLYDSHASNSSCVFMLYEVVYRHILYYKMSSFMDMFSL